VKAGARYIRSLYIKIGDESALVTLCLGEQFLCIWECSCGMRGGRSDGTTADVAMVACRESYKAHCLSTHPTAREIGITEMDIEQIDIQWIGGVWDGRRLTVNIDTAIQLLGQVLLCPSQGAPFMVVAKMEVGSESVLSYRADDQITNSGILYLRILDLA
jgi:hypothetical protein